MNGAPEQLDRAELIAAIAARRDRRAFARLFAYYAPRLKAYMQRGLGASGELAEEMAQETMLMVWRKAALFDPKRASASAWVFAIARNQRVDALRRDRPAPEIGPADAPEPPPAPDAVLAITERARHLRAALATLPPEQAEVVRLSFFDDRPHAEIERALGVPLGTVKSRLRLAMAKLRAVLDDLR